MLLTAYLLAAGYMFGASKGEPLSHRIVSATIGPVWGVGWLTLFGLAVLSDPSLVR